MIRIDQNSDAYKLVRKFVDGLPEDVVKVLDRLNEVGEPLIFGGAIRNTVWGMPINDLDVVLHGTCRGLIQHSLGYENFAGPIDKYEGSGYRALSSTKSGVKINTSIPIDSWHLKDTWAIGNACIEHPHIPDLLNSSFFIQDAVCFSWKTKELYARGEWLEAMTSQVIDINYWANAEPDRMYARIIRFLSQGRTLSDRAKQYIIEAEYIADSRGKERSLLLLDTVVECHKLGIPNMDYNEVFRLRNLGVGSYPDSAEEDVSGEEPANLAIPWRFSDSEYTDRHTKKRSSGCDGLSAFDDDDDIPF